MSVSPLPTDVDGASRPTRSGQPMRVAVVDADSGFVQVLTKRMDRIGWEHRVLAPGAPPRDVVAMRVSAVVVDLALLGPQAWDYLETLRDEPGGAATVVCTGRSSVAQRVRGLRLGADDWVTKPCHPEEVIARVQAVLRRRAAHAIADRVLISGELTVRADHFQAYVAGASVDLTRREFELLQLLARSEGRVLEREEIYQRVWGYAMAHGDRSVDVFVRKLRQKLEQSSPSWRYIHTHFGVGYRFGPETKSQASERAVPDGSHAEAASDAPLVIR